MDILGVIPARKGSKRFKNKTTAILAGKKLIEYSFEAANGSKMLKKVVLSTNDEKLFQLAKKHGIEIIERPDELCFPEVPSALSIIHALKVLGDRGEKYDAVMLLQPTSPLRTSHDIDDSIMLFEKNPNATSLFSVCEYSEPPHWALDMKNGFVTPHFGRKFFVNSEKLPKVYRPNGAIGISKVEDFIKNQSFFTKKTLGFVMGQKKSIDIDYEYDLKLAEFILGDPK